MVKKNCHNLYSLHKWIILMSNVIPGGGGGGGGGGEEVTQMYGYSD